MSKILKYYDVASLTTPCPAPLTRVTELPVPMIRGRFLHECNFAFTTEGVV